MSETRTLYFDTEFLREKTYHPLLCLAQINTGSDIYLIDPLAECDYEAFWSALLDRTLVMHSGRQDLEVLNLAAGKLPAQVFDTQIAAGIAGLPPQVGYANLVSNVCNVDLAKAHTRTDWSRRPLPQAVLDYAADDVEYLPAIERHLTAILKDRGRWEWVIEDCAALLDPALYVIQPDEAWRKLRGTQRLPIDTQQRARALAAWRERIAVERNLPRQWVIRDEQLIGIALENPPDKSALADIKGVHRKFVDRHYDAVITALQSQMTEIAPPQDRPDEAERLRTKAIAAAVKQTAASLDMEGEILAPMREIKRAARGDTNLRALTGWRNDVVGDVIRNLMPD